eukprot:gene8235-16937_t
MSTEHSSIDIKLKKNDRVYKPNDTVEGRVLVNAFKGWQHQGIKMCVDGFVYLSTSSTNGGLLDAATTLGAKTIKLLREDFEIAGPGNFIGGCTEIPFEFQLKGSSGQSLIETYHGVFISVIYSISLECERGVMKKSLQKRIEFYIETPVEQIPDPVPAIFDITPETLENIKPADLPNIPKFRIIGKIFRANSLVNFPFDGEINIEKSDSTVKSIELQLVRVETVNIDSQNIREATEIQNIQIADGNICRLLNIPMHMVFPKRFSCPTVLSSAFKIEFEINLMVIFGDGYMITENFPVILLRGS